MATSSPHARGSWSGCLFKDSFLAVIKADRIVLALLFPLFSQSFLLFPSPVLSLAGVTALAWLWSPLTEIADPAGLCSAGLEVLPWLVLVAACMTDLIQIFS